MACNCGSKSPSMKYLYTSPTGQSTVYNTQVEARAAQIRNDGGTIQELRGR